MADSIAASTLLLTAIALLYTAWYADMKKAHEEHYPTGGPQNAGPAIKRVRWTRNGRALPLALAASLDVVIFAPPTMGLIATSLRLLVAREGQYDAVVAALVLIWAFTIVLAGALIREWWELRIHEEELAGRRPRRS